MTTIQAALQDAVRQLQTDSAQIDAEILLSFVLNKPRSYLFTWPLREISVAESEQFFAFIRQRQQGMPVAYLIGHREFWTMSLTVNPHVLIPRPETELLVELALKHLNRAAPLNIADIGTGSGAIALALAKERPNWHIIASDISSDALQVAKDNAARLQIKNVEFKLGSYCEQLVTKMDAIISNPPYIAENDAHLNDLRFEPQHALVANDHGLFALQSIIVQAKDHLNSGGLLLLEHGYDQASEVAALLKQHGYQNVQNHLDLAHIPRCTSAEFKHLSL